MIIAAALVIFFMKTDRVLSKKEGVVLILFYILFLITELILGKII